MSDKPIESILLQDASPELQRQFLNMVKDQKDTFELQKTKMADIFNCTCSVGEY